MKKHILLLFYFFGSLWLLSAQSLVIYDNDGKNITNSSVTLSFGNNETSLKQVFLLKNPGESEIVVSMRKVEVDVLGGTVNSFGFAGRGYSPSVFLAPHKMTVGPGETSTQNQGYVEYFHNGNTGSTTIKYEFFSEEKAFETVYVQVTFSLPEPTNPPNVPFANVVVSDPYPNPARGHTTIDYQFTPEVKTARVIIRSLTGQVVQILPLNVAANSIRIDTSSLNSGMYFYSIELNNQVFLSKRLIVGR